MSAALAVCALYFAVFIAIGFAADRRGSGSAESFYLGDRNFGAVPTALSVGASDSSAGCSPARSASHTSTARR
ncbi:MAG TPA: hypothetical protein IAD35_08005 [Candidatus Caccocola faecigallinarum]|nr:hypothetical protein [Candidatus Caccocola faecigallinarum]